jgi:hypothetical protein
MAVPDGLQYATQFQLTELTIVGVSGASVDLREVMRELNIFEDIFSNTMTGDVFINDSQNLINLVPILGGEYLRITLVKPSTPWKLSKTFRIYKITDRRKNTTFSEDYVLHFCSEEHVLSESIKISKSYKSLPISSIIKDIATNYLQIDSKKFPSDELTTTTGNFDIIIPYWTPFYAINWLARMATTASAPGCSFMFFEDSMGFHFSSIELLSQQVPLQVINFMPLNLSGETNEKGAVSDTQQRLESAEEFEMNRAPDLIRSISTGMYAGKLTTIHPLEQRIKVRTSNAAVLFNSTKHLNPHTFMQLGQDRTKVPQTEHFDSFSRVAADNLKVHTWMLQRNAYLSALHGFQIKVSLPGNMYLRVGQVVKMNLPSAEVSSQESKSMDRLFSGNYLITAIRHKIDRIRYVCILELSKDSIVPQMPSSLEGSAAMTKIRKA